MEAYCLEAAETAERWDVIVAGGGPAGTAAAVTAARRGLKTLLLENTGCLGGTSTSGALPFWLGAMTGSIPFRRMVEKGLRYRDLPRPRAAVGGLFLEAVRRIKEAGGGVGPAVLGQTDRHPGLDRLGCHDEFTFDLETGKRVLDEMAQAAGVRLLFHTVAVGTRVSGRRVEGVFTANKDGLSYVKADAFLDCTGDADLVARSGFATYKGDRETGVMTASSLVAHIEGIDAAEVERYLDAGGDPWFQEICGRARTERPGADIPRHLIIFPMVQDGVFMVNGGTAFDGWDGTSARDMTSLMLIGRQRARVLVEDLFRPYMPGAAHCRLRLTAAYPGIRETRRIVAEYILTEEDLLAGKRFPDTVALAGRHFDLSRGGAGSGQPFHDRNLSVKGGITPIPFRAMVPRDTENILAAGRCVAADGQALGPARIMSTCFAMGEAAGVAAALALSGGKRFRDVDTEKLRDELRGQGALVD